MVTLPRNHKTDGSIGESRATGFFDVSVYVLGALVVLAVVAFGAYYKLDRRVLPGPSLVDRQLRDYEEAVLAAPDSLPARLSLAEVYESKQRFADAEEQYRAAIELEPGSGEAYLGRGRAQLALGDLEGAASSLQQVIDLRKDGEFAMIDNVLQEAYYYLGEVRLGQQDYGAAIDSLKMAVTVSRTDADAWHKLCLAYSGASDNASAIDACRQAAMLAPDFADAYGDLARIYQDAGQPLQARWAAAMVLVAGGQSKRALPELRAIAAEKPDYTDGLVGLGLAAEGAGQRAEALGAYQQALAVDHDNLLARLGYARVTSGQP